MGNILTTLNGYFSSRNQIRDALPNIKNQTAKPVEDSDTEYESCTDDDDAYQTVHANSFNNNNTENCNNTTAYKSATDIPVLAKTKYKLKLNYHGQTVLKIPSKTLLAETTLAEPSVSEDFQTSESSSREDSNDSENSAVNMVTANTNNNTSSDLQISVEEDRATTAAESIYELANDDKLKEAANGSLAWEVNITDDVNAKKRKKSPPKHLKEVLKRRKASTKYIASRPQVTITNEEIAERKVFDLRRWHCMSRPQYAKSCGITSVVSVWNYFYSTIGNGTLSPLTQEHALDILGFKEPFGEIRFGPFTGNATLMRWFRRLSDHFGVKGRSYYMYKPKGNIRTQFMTDEAALSHLRNGLKDERMAYIYHCYNHYFCPIGYEDAPMAAIDAYKTHKEIVTGFEDRHNNTDDLPTLQPFETWILIGENSKRQPTIHCKKWSDISIDLNMESPHYYNIRHPEKGVMTRKTKKKGRNLHCIIAFKKL